MPSGNTAQAANGMDFRELDKLNWRLHLSNNNNIVNYSANRHLGPDAAEERRPELLVSQVNCGTGVNTMSTNQKRAATTSAQAVAVDEQVVGAVGGGGAKAEEALQRPWPQRMVIRQVTAALSTKNYVDYVMFCLSFKRWKVLLTANWIWTWQATG